jgi:hypothetical protein
MSSSVSSSVSAPENVRATPSLTAIISSFADSGRADSSGGGARRPCFLGGITVPFVTRYLESLVPVDGLAGLQVELSSGSGIVGRELGIDLVILGRGSGYSSNGASFLF